MLACPALTPPLLDPRSSVSAYIIGTVTMLATTGDAQRSLYREQLKQLQKFATAHKLPPALHRTMKAYIGLRLSSSYVSADFEASLPPFLQARIRNVRHRPLLSSIPLLAGEAHVSAAASDNERVASLHFLTALISRLSEVVLMDGVRVFEPHDVVQARPPRASCSPSSPPVRSITPRRRSGS